MLVNEIFNDNCTGEKVAAHIISIAFESPHNVTNGYNLRVHNLLINAALRSDTEVHCIAPVTAANIDAALTWAVSNNIRFHGVLLEREMQYDKSLRAIFRKEGGLLLSSIANTQSIILMHGLISIIDFADLELSERSIADMIDEVGPLMIRNIKKHLAHGRLTELLRAVKYLWIYYSKTIHLVGRRYRHITVVSHDDALRLRKLLPSKSIIVIPNGVDLPDHFSRNPSFEKPIVLFHGVYGYEPNEQAALFLIKRVAPLLGKKWPHCKVVIVGRNPTRRMLDAACSAFNVEIVGEVDNMSDHLFAASVGAYPIFTRTGLQNKILEAWSHGLPVVTTPGIMSVFSAFSCDASQCARTAVSENEFVEQICALLCDAASCSQLSTHSSEFVQKYFGWQGVVEQYLQLGTGNASIG